MCTVYNQIGCLTAIKSHLRNHGVDEYRSVNELLDFQRNYLVAREKIFSNHKLLIEQEKSMLGDEMVQLDQAILTRKNEVNQQLISELKTLEHRLYSLPSRNSNIFHSVVNYVKRTNLKLRILNNNRTFNSKVENSVKYLIKNHDEKNWRHQYIILNFDKAVTESCLPQVQEHDRKKRVIDQVNSSIYGALGEQKVVKELEKLSNDNILINDFRYQFGPPIYNRKENDPIKSIQIDHILIAPSGIFLIETKNWSQQSLENRSLHSPVHQIKRTNFALYKILKDEIPGAELILNKHHWGERKIPLRNLIVLINHKPIEEFEHVKVLTLNDLLGYVRYFKPCFSTKETQMIADYLLSIQ
jgi:hypothetical protein